MTDLIKIDLKRKTSKKNFSKVYNDHTADEKHLMNATM